jgi:urease accessory protein
MTEMSSSTSHGRKHTEVAKLGIGGPVGSGKTTLVKRLVPELVGEGHEVAVLTNDLLTQEDAEEVRDHFEGTLAPGRVKGVETGACPHTGIREDPSMNLHAIDGFVDDNPELDIVLIESGGDNLAATFNPELADYFVYVISVAEGDDIPRKKGPGVVDSDLLVVNKTDLAPHVGADIEAMREDCESVRDGPSVFTNAREGEGIDEVVDAVERNLLFV